MSARQAACPSCGAEIEFQTAASLFVVCPFCSHASWRKDARLELVGRVAEIAPIESPIALRATGALEGRRFTVVGQLQLDHGAGPWNEWAITFDDGSPAWLAEAQGQYLVTRAVDVDVAAIPSWSRISAGDAIDLRAHGRWVVAEKGTGAVVAARGELFAGAAPGSIVRYADLSGDAGAFGTLDFQAGETCEAAYLGRRCELADLALDTVGADARARRTARAGKLDCPSCQGAIDLRDPDGARRIGCPYCGALLDPTSQAVRVVEAARELARRPTIPIGAKGRFGGRDHEVIAFLERSVTSEDVRYPWDEYLLRRDDGAYRWLVSSQGHWSFVEPLNLADVSVRGSRARYDGASFRKFSRGEARVDVVLGEVYWEVAAGETVETIDYVAPPRMVSFETSESEKVVSLGTYLEPGDVTAAFGGTPKLAKPRGVGAQQPNHRVASAKRMWKSFAALALVVVVLGLAFQAREHTHAAFRQTFPARAPESGGDEAAPALVSEEFSLARGGVEVSIVANGLDQGRFELEGALVEVATHAVRDFGLRASTRSAADVGDTLGRAHVTLGNVAPGRYVLRLRPSSSANGGDPSFEIVVQNPVASALRPFLVVLLLLAPPVVASLAAAAFESARWQQSDFS